MCTVHHLAVVFVRLEYEISCRFFVGVQSNKKKKDTDPQAVKCGLWGGVGVGDVA